MTDEERLPLPRIMIEKRCAHDTWTQFIVQLTPRVDDLVRITTQGPLRDAMAKIKPEIDYWRSHPSFRIND